MFDKLVSSHQLLAAPTRHGFDAVGVLPLLRRSGNSAITWFTTSCSAPKHTHTLKTLLCSIGQLCTSLIYMEASIMRSHHHCKCTKCSTVTQLHGDGPPHSIQGSRQLTYTYISPPHYVTPSASSWQLIMNSWHHNQQ
jgi:hypothetical protein